MLERLKLLANKRDVPYQPCSRCLLRRDSPPSSRGWTPQNRADQGAGLRTGAAVEKAALKRKTRVNVELTEG